MKKTLITIAAVLIVGLLAFYFLFLTSFSSVGGESMRVYIDGDDTPDSVYAKLRQNASPRQMAGLRILTAVGGYKQVHPGCYEAGAGVSTLRLYRSLRGGHQVPVRLTIPNVRTTGDLAKRLASQLEADSATLAAAFADTALCSELGCTPQTVACLFIPNTYEVFWNIAPKVLLERMKRESEAFWTDGRRAKAKAAGLTTDEVYILASIVDQETANDAEKPMVAGMYLNRLRQGMKLQADPTVKFALGNFALRRILHEHLTVDSPYNTYKHEGLPPGPIDIPAISSINAVLDYAHHDYIYMCAKEDFSGTHNFARTYEEHLANAARYAKALNERGIK